MSVFDYHRRQSSVTHIGDVPTGGDFPIRLQSMNNTSTTDIESSVAQALRIAEAGADIDHSPPQRLSTRCASTLVTSWTPAAHL